MDRCYDWAGSTLLPGTSGGPASRGYLDYNADHKHWVEPLSSQIAPPADNPAK